MGMLAPRIWQEKTAKPMSCSSSTWWKDVGVRRHCVSVQRFGKAMAPLGHKYLLPMFRYGPALALSLANQSWILRCSSSVVDVRKDIGSFFALPSLSRDGTTEKYPALPVCRDTLFAKMRAPDGILCEEVC